MTQSHVGKVRHLLLVLGDQLNAGSTVFDGIDKSQDSVLMMEVAEEARYVPQHKIRLVLFFSAMRHFKEALEERDIRVHYANLDDDNNRGCFEEEVKRWVNKTRPRKLILCKPGDFRVEDRIRKAASSVECELELREDRHFICSAEDFSTHADGRASLRLETFYREMRRRCDILMNGDEPVGGRWNYDKDNRVTFGPSGPGEIKAPRSFRLDDTTRSVVEMVERRFPDSPGRLEGFDYPVTRQQGLDALRDFIEHRLKYFGAYQDAMVTGHPYLYHSRISSALNLHLLDPHQAIDAAVEAYRDGAAPINAVEGFVRQILGWREFVRGVYWLKMPGYAKENALGADLPMPAFMWTGDTEMNCVRQCVGQLVDHAYAHHIQRLMVLGLFSLLLGVRPFDVHRWHLSMYVDAVDWVSLPNVLGMSQYADGGVVASKPYCASGNYINRMSDYCGGCRYDPRKSVGEDACPITTLYWDFLSRNRRRLRGNHRMGFQLKNLDRKSVSERRAIRERAGKLKSEAVAETYL